MEIVITVITVLIGLIGLLLEAKKLNKYLKLPAEYLQKLLLKGKSSVTKLAVGAKVAKIALLFAEYIDIDLVDSKTQMLDNLENFLRDAINNTSNTQIKAILR